MLALPLMVVLTAPASDGAKWVRDETRFYLHEARYEAKVTEAQAGGKRYAEVDDWSAFVTSDAFVIWDEDDKPELDSGFPLIQHLSGHFYLVGN